MGGIFISYRRKDTAYIAGRLHDRLAAHFGPRQIFRDIETIKPGVDFGELIDEQVGSCDAFLAVIGDSWLVDRNPGGKRPIGVPRDWVQREIEVALARPDLLVVPVLVENATMPSEQELPFSIRALARRNAMELSDQRWDYEVGKLIEALEEVVEPESAASPQALGRGDDPLPPAEVPGPTPLASRWAGRGAGASSSGAAGQTWEPRPVPVAGPSRRPTIPTWLKVVVPVALLLLVLVAFLALGSSGDGDDAAGTTSALPTSPSVPGQPTFPSIPGIPGMSGAGATVKVERVERASDRTRVHLRVKNGGTSPLVLPPQSFTAIDDTGHLYKVHPDSDFPDQVPPGKEIVDVVDLTERLRPAAKTLDVGWTSVLGGLGFSGLHAEKYTLP